MAELEARKRAAGQQSSRVFLGTRLRQHSVTPVLNSSQIHSMVFRPHAPKQFFLKLLVIWKNLLASQLQRDDSRRGW